jgi:hypothetical protein
MPKKRKEVRYRAKSEQQQVLCDECGWPAELVHNIKIYGRPVGEWEWNWLCTNPHCQAHCETVPHTTIPKGPLVSPETKRARIQAHAAFDKIWSNRRERAKAYAWLAGMLGIETKDCHMVLFGYQRCRQVVEIIHRTKPRFVNGRIEMESDRIARNASDQPQGTHNRGIAK